MQPKTPKKKTETRKSLETMGQEVVKQGEPAPKIEPAATLKEGASIVLPNIRTGEPETFELGPDIMPPGRTLDYDTTIYHAEHEPKTLMAGMPIPDGWTTEPGELPVLWKNKIDGTWEKVPRG